MTELSESPRPPLDADTMRSLTEDFYTCPVTGRLIYRWQDSRYVLVHESKFIDQPRIEEPEDCSECGEERTPFWRYENDAVLCLECVEKRLGRDLEEENQQLRALIGDYGDRNVIEALAAHDHQGSPT